MGLFKATPSMFVKKRRMKTRILVLALALSSTSLFAQKVVKTYYDYYNIKLKEEYLVDKNGFRNGYYKEYHPNKQLASIGQYLQDKKTGLWKDFDENGKQWTEATYKAGELHGINKVWNNGMGYHFLSAINTYNMGKQVGQISYYDKSLQMRWDVKSTGENKYWYKNGKLGKVWITQNEKVVPLSTKIYKQNGETVNLYVNRGEIIYESNTDLEFDYNTNDFEISTPTKFKADSAGWQISVYQLYGSNNIYVDKVLADTNYNRTYALKSYSRENWKDDFFGKLLFFSDSNFYCSKTEYVVHGNYKSRKNIITTYNQNKQKIEEITGAIVEDTYYPEAFKAKWGIEIGPYTAAIKYMTNNVYVDKRNIETIQGEFNGMNLSFSEKGNGSISILKNKQEIFRRWGQLGRDVQFAYQELPNLDTSPFSYLLGSAWIVFSENGKEVAEVNRNWNNRNWNQDPIIIKVKSNNTEVNYVFSTNGVVMKTEDVQKLFSDADERLLKNANTTFFRQTSFNIYEEFLKLIEPYKQIQ